MNNKSKEQANKIANSLLEETNTVDAGILIFNLLKEIKRLESINGMICPHCKQELKPHHFKGYYDEFACWLCDCEIIENAEVIKGSYG
jgi:hypothetical protein